MSVHILLKWVPTYPPRTEIVSDPETQGQAFRSLHGNEMIHQMFDMDGRSGTEPFPPSDWPVFHCAITGTQKYFS